MSTESQVSFYTPGNATTGKAGKVVAQLQLSFQ